MLKLDYVNPGLDTTGLYSPRDTGVVTRSKGKLKLDNDVLPLDDSTDTFVRSKKKSYKEIKYKKDYKPEESHNGVFTSKPRRSARLKGGTTFGPSKTANAMFVNGRGMTVLPSSIQAIPAPNLRPNLVRLNAHLLTMDTLESLTDANRWENQRLYHAQLDLINYIYYPDQSDLDWQIEDIRDWTSRKYDKQEIIFLYVVWIGGDKQWIAIDNMRLHDPFLVTRFAVKKNLTSTPGWVWSQDYLGKLPIINHVFKVSRFMKHIKFGIEIPQSTKRAFETDKIEGNNLWKDSMQIEIDQLHAH